MSLHIVISYRFYSYREKRIKYFKSFLKKYIFNYIVCVLFPISWVIVTRVLQLDKLVEKYSSSGDWYLYFLLIELNDLCLFQCHKFKICKVVK